MRKAHDELPEDNAAMWTELEKRADRIEALETALKEAGEMWVRKDNRIEVLENALREIAACNDDAFAEDIARAALDQSSPLKAST